MSIGVYFSIHALFIGQIFFKCPRVLPTIDLSFLHIELGSTNRVAVVAPLPGYFSEKLFRRKF